MSNETRDLVIIGGQAYRVLPGMQVMYNADNHLDYLPYGRMGFGGKELIFGFNKETGKLVDHDNIVKNIASGTFQRIQLPTDIAYLRYAETDRYDQLNLSSKFYNWGIALLGNEYQNRLSGQPPAIMFACDLFEIDVKNNSLINTLDKRRIELNRFTEIVDLSNYDSKLFGYYDLNRHDLIASNQIDEKKCDHIIQVSLPDIIGLDPVGSALKERHDPYVYLNKNPVFHMQAAQVTPMRQVLKAQKKVEGAAYKEHLEEQRNRRKKSNRL